MDKTKGASPTPTKKERPGLLRLRSDIGGHARRPNNLTDASYDLRCAKATARGWLESPEDLWTVDLDRLYRLMIDVYGLEPHEFLSLEIGDVFFNPSS